MGKEKVLTGWYSVKAEVATGHAVYVDVDGGEVKITSVTERLENPYREDSVYKDDAVCVGTIVRYVRGNWKKGVIKLPICRAFDKELK